MHIYFFHVFHVSQPNAVALELQQRLIATCSKSPIQNHKGTVFPEFRLGGEFPHLTRNLIGRKMRTEGFTGREESRTQGDLGGRRG